MSGARMLFEQYQKGGEAYLNGLVGNEIETNLQDFKQFRSTNPNSWGSDDKKSLSESLSGFANSDGGIIVWGVDCRKGAGPTGGDVVQVLVPFPHLTAVLAQMYTLTASLVSPAVIGVEHFAIADSSKPADTGYIVTFVPAGESFPHMAMTGHKYMYRSGSSFLPMDPWMVADRFGRRPHPKLKLIYASKSHDSKGAWKEIGLAIRNDGLGISKFPGFVLHRTDTFNPGSYQQYNSNAEMFPQFGASQLSGQAYKLVILPSRHLEVLNGIKIAKGSKIDLKYELLCDGFYEAGVLVINWSDLP